MRLIHWYFCRRVGFGSRWEHLIRYNASLYTIISKLRRSTHLLRDYLDIVYQLFLSSGSVDLFCIIDTQPPHMVTFWWLRKDSRPTCLPSAPPWRSRSAFETSPRPFSKRTTSPMFSWPATAQNAIPSSWSPSTWLVARRNSSWSNLL